MNNNNVIIFCPYGRVGSTKFGKTLSDTLKFQWLDEMGYRIYTDKKRKECIVKWIGDNVIDFEFYNDLINYIKETNYYKIYLYRENVEECANSLLSLYRQQKYEHNPDNWLFKRKYYITGFDKDVIEGKINHLKKLHLTYVDTLLDDSWDILKYEDIFNENPIIRKKTLTNLKLNISYGQINYLSNCFNPSNKYQKNLITLEEYNKLHPPRYL